jgi:hypothetical protein
MWTAGSRFTGGRFLNHLFHFSASDYDVSLLYCISHWREHPVNLIVTTLGIIKYYAESVYVTATKFLQNPDK